MKKVNLLSFLAIAIILTFNACSPAVYYVGTWVNKEKISKTYHKVYLVSMLDNFMNNAIVEGDFAKRAAKNGTSTIKNTDIFTTPSTDPETRKKEILQKIKDLGCDAVFTVGLKDIKTESRYVPGETIYQPVANNIYYNQFPTYYSNYYDHVGASGYYNIGYQVGTTYETVQTEGHYEEDKVYFIECNLFDTNTLELLFSIQSNTTNPTDVKSISKAFSAEFFKKLKKEGITKTTKG